MADYVGGDMIRGHIDTIILNSLVDGDKDTNQIRTEIESRAGGQFQLKQGTFYSALQRIVKQGYVWEYRTTGSDGVRRKFFQLTEKGKDLIDKNQSSWTMSRQVINTLLDAQSEKIAKAKLVAPVSEDKEENLPDFDRPEVTNFSKLQNKADDEVESIAQQTISSINDAEFEDVIDEPEQEIVSETVVEENINEDISALIEETPPTFNPQEENAAATPQTFDDIMEILESIDRSAKEDQERAERERALALEREKAAEEARLIAEQVEKERAERDRHIADIDIPDEFQLAEERSKQPTPLHDEEREEPEIPEYIQNSLEAEIAQTVVETQPVEEPVNEIDDYLNPDDLPSQKEYKEVLSRIFAADLVQENVVAFPVQEQQNVVEQESTISEPVEETYDRIVDELDFSKPSEKVVETKTPEKSNKKSGAFDYSDIIAMSEREGFKVSTSDRTNKHELGKILINRLNFHTALIFFVLITLETLLVALTMEKVLDFGLEAYIYFSIIVLALPVITGMIYYMAPKRTISEVNGFKSAFETALIITLNLILLILVYVVIIDLDFSSKQAISRNLFLPLLLVINVPIYVIIRYSLLEKQMYFS
ncbi:MAG: helix-turn-helix transcriptional regulator [Clostridia bacterium]|nr:helix-turn-helix transcriptional regulator [Clostridia bacterium]